MKENQIINKENESEVNIILTNLSFVLFLYFLVREVLTSDSQRYVLSCDRACVKLASKRSLSMNADARKLHARS